MTLVIPTTAQLTPYTFHAIQTVATAQQRGDGMCDAPARRLQVQMHPACGI